MQNHLQAMKKKINHYTFINPFDLVCVSSHLQNPFYALCQNQCSFSITQPAFMHVCAAVAPFSAVYLSR